jgi:hypothetical protein
MQAEKFFLRLPFLFPRLPFLFLGLQFLFVCGGSMLAAAPSLWMIHASSVFHHPLDQLLVRAQI